MDIRVAVGLEQELLARALEVNFGGDVPWEDS
jgi:hypothetical protein